MQFPSAALLLAFFLALVSSGAQAGVGERAGEVASAWKGWYVVERTQYYSLDDQNYCWYDDGWQGPGWYWCGYESDVGAGWGGPYGWNGWGGGHRVRRHGAHGIGVWRPGAPNHVRGAGVAVTAPGLRRGATAYGHFGAGSAGWRRPGAGGPSGYPGPQGGGVPSFHGVPGGGGVHGFGAPASPGLQAGGAPAFHGAAGGAGFHGFGAPASPGFQGGGAQGFHGFGGGGLQGFGGAGGSHGGGGAFSVGGRGGGHR